MSVESTTDILQDIDQHVEREWSCKARRKAIGRIMIEDDGKEPQRVWIANHEYSMTSSFVVGMHGDVIGTRGSNIVEYLKDDGPLCCKNTRMGRILTENAQGHFSCKVPKGERSFEILDRAFYSPLVTGAEDIRIDLDGKHYGFKTIMSALFAVKNADDEIARIKKQQEEMRKEQERQKKLAEEKAAKEKAERERREAEMKRIKDEEERKRKEEELRRKEEEERRRQQEEEERLRREAEEKERLLNEELAKKEAEKQASLAKYTQALAFIRNQATLRENPILDKNQNDIKFSHVHDGTAVVIDGGPGTGKSTTLIQRLKLLISQYDLQEYQEEFNLTDKQIELVSNEKRNWIFFSPNELLRQYLRDNMTYEGLNNVPQKTKVWNEYLKHIIRDEYHLAGSDCKLKFCKKDEMLYRHGHHIEIIEDFQQFFVNYIVAQLKTVTEIDLQRFPEWQGVGTRIQAYCNDAEQIKSIRELLSILSRLQYLVNEKVGLTRSVSQMLSEYSTSMKKLILILFKTWKDDEKIYAELNKLIASWHVDDEEEEDENIVTEDEDEETEEDEEELIALSNEEFENALEAPLRALLQKLAMNQVSDTKSKIQGKQAEIYKIVKETIDVNMLAKLGQVAYFRKNVYPMMMSFDKVLFDKLHKIYKEYRKDVLSRRCEQWNLDVLETIIKKDKNIILMQQEMALLLGFINNMVLSIRSYNVDKFDNLKHKYVEAYKECCRPVIGVDEATDYSIIDYYAIASLRDYRVSSITLSGDVMQCMKTDGIIDWKELNHPLIFPKLTVGKLLVSYRQSPELMKLADHLYQLTMGQESPYTCFISSSEITPCPLWLTSDDMEKKARWIARRILEVQKAYGELPSIAIFTKDDEVAAEIVEILSDEDKLIQAGIEVLNCSGKNANLKDANRVRVFAIDKVKGMEFDVVFFYDIDNISDDEDMINKYLYVALSRAAFFMAVTSDGSNQEISDKLKSMFDDGGKWKDIVEAYQK